MAHLKFVLPSGASTALLGAVSSAKLIRTVAAALVLRALPPDMEDLVDFLGVVVTSSELSCMKMPTWVIKVEPVASPQPSPVGPTTASPPQKNRKLLQQHDVLQHTRHSVEAVWSWDCLFLLVATSALGSDVARDSRYCAATILSAASRSSVSCALEPMAGDIAGQSAKVA